MNEDIKSNDKPKMSPYEVLREINVNEHTEKKGDLTYLSWVWALDQLYLHYPQAEIIVHKTPEGIPYWTDGRTCWVDIEVKIDEWTRREPCYPVMDYRNKSIQLDKVTSFDVNTSVQRGTTRCIGRFGLGFYIYAGEDLPPEENAERAAALLKEWQGVEDLLAEAEVDRHDQKVIDWVSSQVKIPIYNLDPTELMDTPDLMRKVMAALRKAAKLKGAKR